MGYFDNYVRDYHNEQQQLSYVNGSSDQFIYNAGLGTADDGEYFCDLEANVPTPISREKMEEHDRLVEKLRHDPEYQRELREIFLRKANVFTEHWHKDKTPPEQRDRLFYARRLASLYETIERKTEYYTGFPQKEWERLSDASERYAELVSILEGKTPQEHYMKRWGFKTTSWRYWPQVNRKEAV